MCPQQKVEKKDVSAAPNFAIQTRANAFDPSQLEPKRAKLIIANRCVAVDRVTAPALSTHARFLECTSDTLCKTL